MPSLDLLALIVQGGAVVVLSLWVWDLRAQNAALRKELKGWNDDVRAAFRKAKPQ